LHRTGKLLAGYQSANQVWRAARRTGWPVIAAVSAAIVLTAGCGNNYRPVVSAINPVGPAGQPTKFAIALSNPTTNGPALVTMVDFSGDTVLSTPFILSNPTYFAISGGSEAYVINASGSLDSFAVANPTAVQTSNVAQTTLLAGSRPVSITAISGTSTGTTIYIPQSGNSSVAALNSTGPALLGDLSVGPNTNFVVGTNSAARVYALSSGAGAGAGVAYAIETTTNQPTISAALQVGINPVYGVITPDLQRAYIANKGSGTVSVINTQTNALDAANPVIPATGTLGVNPVWVVGVPVHSEIAVLNAGDGTKPGSLSIISVPLCNAVTPNGNPNCDPNNPNDAAGFGDVLATVPVGVNPTMVDVLSDGTRAYVVNQANIPSVCGGEGSVSVVNLNSGVVTATICAISTPAGTLDPSTNPTLVYGHPNTVSVTSGTPTGKVYITSWDNKYMTILRTDQDTVQTHISLQGTGIGLPTGNQPQSPGVLVTAP
jgi:YVTN family beta-propeller protein